MKWQERTKTGKQINVPTRGFKPRDLDEMGVTFVEGALLFNLHKHNVPAPDVSGDILDHMTVGSYPDCTQLPFTAEKAAELIESQLTSAGDFVFVQSFRKETDYDTRARLNIARSAKKQTEKEVIFEISYSSKVPTQYLIENRVSFDKIAIFYGSHHMGTPAFEQIASRIMELRVLSDIPIILTGMPLLMQDGQKRMHFMPFWSLVGDGWVKCWRKGGSNPNGIKLVDMKDRKNKTREEWIGAGHLPSEVIKGINRTVYDLFADDARGEEAQKMYKEMVMDEILAEIDAINPQTIENYAVKNFALPYGLMIIRLYGEKVLARKVNMNPAFAHLSVDDVGLVQRRLRVIFSPPVLDTVINSIVDIMRQEGELPAKAIIEIIDRFTSS